MTAILFTLLAAVAGGILLAAAVIAFFVGYHTGWRACDQDRDSLEAHYGGFDERPAHSWRGFGGGRP